MPNLQKVQIGVAVALLALLVFVAVNPHLVYAPVPRVVIFLLAAIFPALLITTTASTHLKLQVKGFLFMTSGASALFVALLLLLAHVAKPELQVVTFDVVDERGNKVNLNPYYAFRLETNPGGLVANYFTKENSVVLIFPEQLATQRISVQLSQDTKAYGGIINYAKPPTESLRIGRDLK